MRSATALSEQPSLLELCQRRGTAWLGILSHGLATVYSGAHARTAIIIAASTSMRNTRGPREPMEPQHERSLFALFSLASLPPAKCTFCPEDERGLALLDMHFSRACVITQPIKVPPLTMRSFHSRRVHFRLAPVIKAAPPLLRALHAPTHTQQQSPSGPPGPTPDC